MGRLIIDIILAIAIIMLLIDGLTFTWTRRMYQIAYKVNNKIGGWVVFIDIDGLKKINDKEGHVAGDRALRDFGKASLLASKGRSFRYGGDEFVILTFSRNYGKAEKIVEAIKARKIVSFAYGIGRTEQEADKRMYEDKKKKGREH